MIAIPDSVWQTLLDEFARAVQSVERVAYLDGFLLGDSGVVTTVTLPDAELNPGFFTVSAETMSQAGRHFRQYGMARLVQVHTHGGSGCYHSDYDDKHAYSQRRGALSIVLPYHARNRPTPFDGVIHLREESGWLPLTEHEAAQVIRIVPSLLDYRSPIWIESTTGTLERWMANCSRWIRQLPSRSRSFFRPK